MGRFRCGGGHCRFWGIELRSAGGISNGNLLRKAFKVMGFIRVKTLSYNTLSS